MRQHTVVVATFATALLMNISDAPVRAAMQADPHTGTWVLNVAKRNTHPDPLQRSKPRCTP